MTICVDMLAAGQLENLFDEIGSDHAPRFRAEALGKIEQTVQPLRGAWPIWRRRSARSIDTTSQGALRPDASRAAVRTTFSESASGPDAHQQPLCRLPRSFDGVLLQVVDHLVVDPVGGAAQRQFAQRRQVADAKEAVAARRALSGR